MWALSAPIGSPIDLDVGTQRAAWLVGFSFSAAYVGSLYMLPGSIRALRRSNPVQASPEH